MSWFGMSRFGIKIYMVLFIMGAVPLVVAVFVRQEIMIFDRGVQQEALSTIEFAAELRKAWFVSFGGEADLMARLLVGDKAVGGVLGDEADEEDGGRGIWLRGGSGRRRDYKRRCGSGGACGRRRYCGGGEVLAEVLHREPPDPERFRIFDVRYDLATGRRLAAGNGGGGQGGGGQGGVLALTFVLPLEYFKRFDALGEQRQLYLTLNDMEQPEQQDANQFGQAAFNAVILGVVVALTIGFALLITTPINRRLARLTEATKQVAAGDLSVQVPVTGKDEIAQLTERFNAMVGELNEAHNRLKYLERMSAWQEVARRLAHEIKNPLTPLQLAIQQLDRKFDDYRERPQRYRALVSEVVEIVNEEIATLQKLVKEFSEFARLPAVSLRPARLSLFVAHTLRSNPQLGQSASIRHLVLDDEVWVKLDRALMRRVLVNVFQNAIEAVEPTGRRAEVEVHYERLPERGMVRMRVFDNGPGIRPEHQAKLFEPYFTTKERGTGLGLAIVRKILIDHGGDIALLNRYAPDSTASSPSPDVSVSGGGRRSRDVLPASAPLGAEVRIDLPLSVPDPDGDQEADGATGGFHVDDTTAPETPVSSNTPPPNTPTI